MKQPADRKMPARLPPAGTRRMTKAKKERLPQTPQRDDFMFMPMEKCAAEFTRGGNTRESVAQVSGIPK